MSDSADSLSDEFLDRRELEELDRTPWLVPEKALTCDRCDSTAEPALVKPRKGSASWWDDPGWFWICPDCGICRKFVSPNPRPERRPT